MDVTDLPIRDGWGEWQRAPTSEGFRNCMVCGMYGVLGAAENGELRWKVVYAEDDRSANWHSYESPGAAMVAAERLG